MTAPDRIAAYWTAADNDTMPSQMLALTPKSPRFHDDMPKSQRIEYVRADLVDPAAIREAAWRELAEMVRGWRNTIPMTGDECAEAILALIPKGAADDRA